MKAMYITPVSEVMQAEAIALMTVLSGAGMNDGGQANQGVDPQ